MTMTYSTIVRNYLAMQRNKPMPKSGIGRDIRHLIDLTEHRLGQRPSLVQTTAALILAGYEIEGAPNSDEYYLNAY